MSAPETPQPLRAEDLPPSPPPRKRRGMGTVRSMVLSMIVLCAMLFAYVAMVPRPKDFERLPVDSASALKNARAQSKVEFSGLDPLPGGWKANNAAYTAAGTGIGTWNVGYVHGDAYNGLKQAPKVNDDWYAFVLKGFARDGSQSVGGTQWERWIDHQGGERRLVRRGGAGLTTVVSSSVSYDDAAAFAARLTPKP